MATKSQISTLDDSTDEPVAPVVLKGAQNIEGTSGKKEILTIYSSPEQGGSDAVFCGLNGYAFQVPRDVPSLVPEELVQVLRNAIVTSYVDIGGGQFKETNRPRFAFSSTPA